MASIKVLSVHALSVLLVVDTCLAHDEHMVVARLAINNLFIDFIH